MTIKIVGDIPEEGLGRAAVVSFLTATIMANTDEATEYAMALGKVEQRSAVLLTNMTAKAIATCIIREQMRNSEGSAIEYVTRLQRLVDRQVEGLFKEALETFRKEQERGND